jgi:hypothetical protein
MTRTYTDGNGDAVIATDEMLDVAIRIKEELQKSSNGRRASWKQIVKGLHKEGFTDIKYCEGLRCCVKAHQKALGTLETVEKRIDEVTTNKLEYIKELVGEVAFEKRSNQIVLRDLNKVKREIIDYTLITEEISESFKNHKFEFQKDVLKKKKESNKKMLVQISDAHIGAKIDNEFYKFNYAIATDRLLEFADRIIEECKLRNITSVYVISTGDEIENFQMHATQPFEAEFVLSEQITKATDLYIIFLVKLADNGLQVTYSGISGNHSRLNGIKNMAQHGDNAIAIINHGIKSFIKHAKFESIEYIQAKPYEHSFVLNGVPIKALHGDLDDMRNEATLLKHSQLDGIQYKLIIGGHVHEIRITPTRGNGFLATSGGLKSVDTFHANHLRKDNLPSQNYYVIHDNGDIDVKWVIFRD